VIIDVHSHLYDDNPATRNYQFPGEPHGRISAKRFVSHALAQPVDRMVLSADPTWLKDPAGLARANDRVASIVRRQPKRFSGLCQVNPLFGKASIAEMDKHIAKGNLSGVGEICPYIFKCDSGNKREFAIVEKAIELDATILYHSSNARDSGAVDRLATMFPQARFVMAHIGGMYNWPNGIAVARKHDNVWVDTSGYVMLCYGAMVKAVKALGPSKILFGVDFPLILAAPLVTVLKDLKLPRAAFARIAWKNAAELFAV